MGHWKLKEARTILRWKNGKGLSHAAQTGPEHLELEYPADEEFHELAVVKWISCDQEAWKGTFSI